MGSLPSTVSLRPVDQLTLGSLPCTQISSFEDTRKRQLSLMDTMDHTRKTLLISTEQSGTTLSGPSLSNQTLLSVAEKSSFWPVLTAHNVSSSCKAIPFTVTVLKCCIQVEMLTVLIIKTALEKAAETVLVDKDTDLLVLLQNHFGSNHRSFQLTSSGTKKKQRYDIRSTQESLGKHVCRRILFAHMFRGRDTTSAVFTTGKSHPMKKLAN